MCWPLLSTDTTASTSLMLSDGRMEVHVLRRRHFPQLLQSTGLALLLQGTSRQQQHQQQQQSAAVVAETRASNSNSISSNDPNR